MWVVPPRYHTTGFVAKNNDSLHRDLLALVRSAEFDFVADIFHMEGSAAVDEINAQNKKRMDASTVAQRCRGQMRKLRETLGATTLSFVRCVKPNPAKAPHAYDPELVRNQLNYLGVMETVRIRRCGYPVRRAFKDIVEDYGLLLPKAARDDAALGDRERCAALLGAVLGAEGDEGGWQLGHTKAFMRDGCVAALDEALQALMNKAASNIALRVRGMIARKHLKQQKQARHTHCLCPPSQVRGDAKCLGFRFC